MYTLIENVMYQHSMAPEQGTGAAKDILKNFFFQKIASLKRSAVTVLRTAWLLSGKGFTTVGCMWPYYVPVAYFAVSTGCCCKMSDSARGYTGWERGHRLSGQARGCPGQEGVPVGDGMNPHLIESRGTNFKLPKTSSKTFSSHGERWGPENFSAWVWKNIQTV